MTRPASYSSYKSDADEIIAAPIRDERRKLFLIQAAGVIMPMNSDASLFSQPHDRPVENALVVDLGAQGVTQLGQLHGRAGRGGRLNLQHPLQNQPLQVDGVVTRWRNC